MLFIFFSLNGEMLDFMKIVTYIFKRLFELNCKSFLLADTTKRHIAKFKDHYSAAFNILDNCVYVDDLVYGNDNTSEGLTISREIKTTSGHPVVEIQP